MAKVVDRKDMDLIRQSYVTEITKGVILTTRQFLKNVPIPGLKGRDDTQTVRYPEVKNPYPDRFRGRHRLMKREDEQVRCVACMLCSTACPANCIEIKAAEHDDAVIEKYPEVFAIDLLKCIYCGFCVEACPCDAIRMDTGVHTIPTFDRRSQNAGKIDLLSLGATSTAAQGGEWRADPDSRGHH